jgi:GNAT superfamily N-acetyltransferase
VADSSLILLLGGISRSIIKHMSEGTPEERRGIVLEMTDPARLRPGRNTVPLILREVGVERASLIGQLYREIWNPLGGGGRGAWDDARWVEELRQPGIRTWVAEVDGQAVGFAEMGWRGDGDVAFIVLGIIPSVQSRGIGADLLTRTTHLAWDTPASNGAATTRVWLWTVPNEHPHTISNYLARGYQRGPDID